MKTILGSVVFVASLFLLHRILVGSGMLTPTLAFFFLACLVGVPLGGIVFLEGSMDQQNRELRRELDALRAEVDTLKKDRPAGGVAAD